MDVRHRINIAFFAAVLWTAAALACAPPARAQSLDDLQKMSVGELADIDVSSVTKTPEALSDAPGAVFVISHEDIARSGAVTVPEILRLAPNLQVAQTSAGRYVITARGFSGNAQAQDFSNKLLVLIDGRTVYTPLYSGVYWDTQDVLPEDIDRIEVISGPGATLWGANAVNGVINIITRKSSLTQGGYAEITAGDQQRSISLRYGGRVGETLTWRLYGRDLIANDTVTTAGVGAHDQLNKPQTGFRMDWTPSPVDAVTLQGDAYRGTDGQGATPDEVVRGQNVTARWTRQGEGGSSLQVQGYIDHTARSTEGMGDLALNIYDLDVQYAAAPGGRQQWVVGAGVRANHYRINSTGGLLFTPTGRTLNQGNVFVQDSIAITSNVRLMLGVKVEGDPYLGPQVLPSVRVSWKPNASILLWAAASRAIRSPSPFDRDVVEILGGSPFLIGGHDFQPETLKAYELGGRFQISSHASLSVSTYYNDYDNLRSIEITPVTVFPLVWGNGIAGHTYGLEAWGDYQILPWWRLTAGVNLLRKDLHFKPGSAGLFGVKQAGDDPGHQVFVGSSMNLGRRVTFDANLRSIGALPNPAVPAYTELNLRLAWMVTSKVQLSINGANLLHDHHQEFPGPQANAIPRAVSAGLQWRF